MNDIASGADRAWQRKPSLFDEASWRLKAAWRALRHGWETIR